MSKVFADRLKELRIENNLTQEQAGNIFGLSKQVFSNYESGTREPKIDTIIQISKNFGVSTDYLLGLSNDKLYPVLNPETGSANVLDTYYKGVLFWSEDRIFNIYDTMCIKEHFQTVLFLYKELINRLSTAKYGLKKYKEFYKQYNKKRANPLTEKEIELQYFNQELKICIVKITDYIQYFPDTFVRSSSESEEHKKQDL